MERKNAVITGGAGFVASHLAEAIKDKYNIDFTTKEITDVIITALCNYYDYNELHPSEGRMVVTAIRDIQRYVRDIKYDNILDDLMDIISNERTGQEEDLKDAIYDYFNKLKNK